MSAAYDFQNLRTYENAGSGIAAFALLAPYTWFTTPGGIKAPLAPFTAPGDSITIKTAHDFITDKGFIYVALAPQKNELDANSVGDVGFNKQVQEATLFFPGSNPALHETFQQLLNVPLIALVKDSNCGAGLYYQLGCDCEYAYISGGFKSGFSNAGVKGYTAKLNYDGGVQFYQVTGGPEILADPAP